MPVGVTEEHEALGDSVGRWVADHAPPEVVREVLEAGVETPPPFWGALAEQGLLGLHVPAEHGGAGYGLVEAAVATEALGRGMVPGPFVPTVLASAVVDRTAGGTARKELLGGLADGTLTGAVALRPGLEATVDGEGLRLDGTTEPVLSAPTASVVIVGGVDGAGAGHWAVLDRSDIAVRPVPGVDRTRGIGEVRVEGLRVPPERRLGPCGSTVRRLAAVVGGAEAAGLAGWALDTAVDHAATREQFGRPIGQFQAIKHRCAEMLVRVEQARATTWDAARAADGDVAALTAAMAAATAPEAAVGCAKDCIQILGGIGYTWEHDAHLYLKRATALRQLLGGTGRWRVRTAELARAGHRRELDPELDRERAGEHRRQVREFLDGIEDLDGDEERRAIAEAGYLQPHWPEPWGRDAGAVEQLVIDQEFRRREVDRPELIIGAWALPTIIAHGTDEQAERFVPPTLAGELMWCQMFSEPGAGSDLASLSTRAERVEGGFELTGQKVWTSVAQVADWAICLARTDPDAPKHEGITYFLVDMDSPGIDVRPLTELTGRDAFNEVFLDGVFVPDDCVVGEVDGGWELARTTLANERVAMSSGSSLGGGVEDVLSALDDDPVDGGPSARVMARVGDLVCEGQSLSLLSLRTTLRQLSGIEPGAASSVKKLIGMHHMQDCSELVLQLQGPAGATREGAAGSAIEAFLRTRALSIAGGTTEVQRNIVGERILGLPRDEMG